MTSSIDRRSVLLGASAAVAALTLPASLSAMTQAEARGLIGQVMGEVQGAIASGRSEAQVIRDFERIFDRHGDVAIIARSVLGPPARTAGAQELRTFTEAFRGYLARKYGRQFRRFAGARAEVTGARSIQRHWEVVSVMHMRGEAPFEVRWHVSDQGGQHRFFNIIIEGVNLLAAERQEIGTMLERRGGSIARLTEDLRRAG